MHFNGRFIVNIADFAAIQGADYASLIECSGLNQEALSEETCRVSTHAYDQVLRAALRQTEDSLFGLHLGQHLNLAAAGLIAQIAQTSETVLQALKYCCAFSNLTCSALSLQMQEEPFQYRLLLQPNSIWFNRSPDCVFHTALGYLMFTVREFQSLTHQRHFPTSINLIFPKPASDWEIKESFGCSVNFGQLENSITFKREHLMEKVVTSDFRLLQILVKYAHQKIANLRPHQNFYQLVKDAVVHLIRPGFPTLRQIADHLNVSVRTLQRKLQIEGRTYKELLDELRFEFSMQYISDSSLSIGDIAYLLNYADASTFIRSFKRWTGKTPGEFRDQQYFD